jgi:hypothetical protein
MKLYSGRPNGKRSQSESILVFTMQAVVDDLCGSQKGRVAFME